MQAYDVFGAAAKTHALKVVLNGTAVSGQTKSKVKTGVYLTTRLRSAPVACALLLFL
jgi:hypothetical protein